MNNSFKTLLLALFASAATFVSMTFVSCNRDKCKSIVCANNGVCNDGACTCPSGYEGSNCETVARSKYVGNWTVNEKGSVTNEAQYSASISNGNNITDLQITNFFNYFRSPINAYVVNDTIYIPNQQLEGKVVFGYGYLYTTNTYGQYGAINFTYEVIDTATNTPDDFGFYIPDGSLPSVWTR
jgi:hypothetical protein